MKGTFFHIHTGTKQFQMSFYTLDITYLKILIKKIIRCVRLPEWAELPEWTTGMDLITWF